MAGGRSSAGKMEAPLVQSMAHSTAQPALRDGKPARYRDARRYLESLGPGVAPGAYSGLYRCRGCGPCCDILPSCIYLQPCGGCCLYGIWCFLGIPCPAVSCLTACLCREGESYITQRAGIKTGELIVVDADQGTLAMYGGCGDAIVEENYCYCTKVGK